MPKAADVADLGDQSDGTHRVNAAQGAQCRYDGFEAPAFGRLGQRSRQPVHELLGGLRSQLVLGQRDAVTVVLEALLGDPALAALGPVRLAGIATAMAKQEPGAAALAEQRQLQGSEIRTADVGSGSDPVSQGSDGASGQRS